MIEEEHNNSNNTHYYINTQKQDREKQVIEQETGFDVSALFYEVVLVLVLAADFFTDGASSWSTWSNERLIVSCW